MRVIWEHSATGDNQASGAVAACARPEPRDVLQRCAALQLDDGHWELTPELADILGLPLCKLETALGLFNGAPTAEWRQVVATVTARMALERAATVAAAKSPPPDEGNMLTGASRHAAERERRQEALSLAHAASRLGDRMAGAADEWVERTFVSAGPRGACKKPHLEVKVAQLLEGPLPRPDWRLQLAAKQSQRLVCDKCGEAFSSGIGKCPACFPPAPPPSAELQRATTADDLRRWSALPPAPTSGQLTWVPEATRYLSGGSGGVVMLQLPEGAVCVKPLKGGAVAEHLASAIAAALAVRTAALRAVPYGVPEFLAVKQACRSGGQEAVRRATSGLEFLGVLEFVPGVILQGPAALEVMTSLPAEDRRGIWMAVGRLVAVDAIINNVDRVPLLWNNDGNTSNIMVCTGSGDTMSTGMRPAVVGIDQAVMAIRAGQGRDKYLARLRQLAALAFSGLSLPEPEGDVDGPWSPQVGLTRVRQAFLLNCGLEADLGSLMEGLREVFSTVAERQSAGEFTHLLEEAADEASKVYWSATTEVGLSELPFMLDFIASTVAEVTSSASAAKETAP